MTAVSTAERAPINGPHDGKFFRFDTLQELFYCLTQLRADGYHVPESAFAQIEEEMNEEPTQ